MSGLDQIMDWGHTPDRSLLDNNDTIHECKASLDLNILEPQIEDHFYMWVVLFLTDLMSSFL